MNSCGWYRHASFHAKFSAALVAYREILFSRHRYRSVRRREEHQIRAGNPHQLAERPEPLFHSMEKGKWHRQAQGEPR